MATGSSPNGPILVRVFYRTNGFHRPEEFADPTKLPHHLDIHTFPDSTLETLTQLIADAPTRILPSPAIGTRLVFRLIFANTRARADAPPKYVTKDIGSIVIGQGSGGPGTEGATPDPNPDRHKTLADARFITGDYISCAILPPSEVTGEIQPASAARTGRGSGIGEARVVTGGPPPGPRRGGGGSEGGYGRGGGGGPRYGRGRGAGLGYRGDDDR
ncbi:Sin3 associated polypeptide p18-domain-containing protein, partial [Podospora australis]